MNESIVTMDRLLREVAGHLKAGTKSDKSAAVLKLQRISAIASTMAITVKLAR